MIFEYLLGFLIAMGIGIIAALVGIGGGVLYVPCLIWIFGLEPRVAIGTSISIILFSTLSGTIAYVRQKRIFYRSAVCLIVPSMIFSVLGAYSTVFISNMLLAVIFSVILMVIGIHMIFPSLPLIHPIRIGPYYDEERTDFSSRKVHNRLFYAHTSAWGAIAGYMSGLTGIGGGIINVPALVIGGMPVHFAVATSVFVILCTSLSATFAHIQLDNISLAYTAVFSAGAVVGAQIGARISPKVGSANLKTGVGIILIFTSLTVIMRYLELMPSL